MYGFPKKPTVAAQKARAERQRRALLKKGTVLSPLQLKGRTIARSFWGQAWCWNLERYSDFANRLPRGRSYLTNGLVLDLQITPGRIRALVSGTSVYTITVEVEPLGRERWEALCIDCAGGIAGVVELLQGRFADAVMQRICRPGSGLFPSPQEIRMECSCPDWAHLCKHLAAVLYGIGARLDQHPELLFVLRQVDKSELASAASRGSRLLGSRQPPSHRLLDADTVSLLFGTLLAPGAPGEAPCNTNGPVPSGDDSRV
jgi:uncharacterized Zn finger protein